MLLIFKEIRMRSRFEERFSDIRRIANNYVIYDAVVPFKFTFFNSTLSLCPPPFLGTYFMPVFSIRIQTY
jgi:hypothetical protein